MPRLSFFCVPLLALAALPLAIRERQVVCPILMYHHLADASPSLDAAMRAWSVAPRDFDAQIAWLADHRYHCVTPAQLADALEGRRSLPSNPVCITFDDGWAEQYSLAWPILRRHGLAATFFVYTAGIGAGGWMTWDQLREMASSGGDIACHTIDHPRLTGMPAALLRRELTESKATIESRLGRPVASIAYPYGNYDDAVLAAARAAGYRCGFSIDTGTIQSASEEFRLRRIMVSNGDPLPVFIQRVTGRTP
jgi:peptidoglycan/xylan/chitin deacetylase (PgdA/CDA1 family)